MKITLTEILPQLDGSNKRSEVTVENPDIETFDELVDLFRGACVAVGFAPGTVNSLRTDRDDRDEAEAAEAFAAMEDALLEKDERQAANQAKHQSRFKRWLDGIVK
jgi:hypothetical protein